MKEIVTLGFDGRLRLGAPVDVRRLIGQDEYLGGSLDCAPMVSVEYDSCCEGGCELAMD